MGHLADTYQHIATILSFDIPPQDLEHRLSRSDFNWDAIVIEGSKHLLLPAIYCRLKAKQLLHVLPEALHTYLEELTAINRNRNKALLHQIHAISQLFNRHQIDHVFLKGAALLALGCYKDHAERMVGDIDILISKPQLHTAFELLKANGYPKTFGFAYDNKNFRHLDRLISDDFLAAVELHDQLLIPKYRHLIDVTDVLNTKVVSHSISIPNSYYLSLHPILGWQINDMAYFYKDIHFKYVYDSVVLAVHANQALISKLLSDTFGSGYLELAKLYFKEFSEIPSTSRMANYSASHQNYRDKRFYRKVLKPIKQGYKFVTHRIYQILSNPSYRKHALKKIFIRKI